MNRHLSDYIPAVIVKDCRQVARTLPHVTMLVLALVGAWMVQLLNTDTAATNTGYVFAILGFILIGWIPYRAYAGVRADTLVKSTNFLMLTPLSPRCIVYSMWVSAVLQAVLFALLCVPLVWWRQAHGTGEDDWRILATLLGIGAVGAAVFMLAARLHVILRIAFLVGAVFFLVNFLIGLLPSLLTGELGTTVIHPVQWFAIAALACTVVGLCLEIGKRYYAPASVNSSWVPRLLMLVPVALAALLCLNGLPACKLWGAQLDLAHIALGLSAYAAVLEAILPAERMPVHDKLAVPGIPRLLQAPGLAGAALWIVVVFLLSLPVDTWAGQLMQGDIQWATDTEDSAVCGGLLSTYAALVCLTVMGLCCKAQSDMRPVVFMGVRLALMLVIGVSCMHSLHFLPEGAPYPLWSSFLPSGFDSARGAYPAYIICRAACCAVLLAALLYIGRGKPAK
ncbi:MAG: hypothetical protein Q3986_05775 [Akkermansia sp.]|nr:hypothetical protein [Akkermansia sp.]